MFRKAERCKLCHLLLVGFARADYRGQPVRTRQLNQDVEFCGSGQNRGFQTDLKYDPSDFGSENPV